METANSTQVLTSTHTAFAVPEILAQILGHTVHVPKAAEREDLLSDETKGHIATQTQTPWPFLPVCKYWYDVIQSTPILWSTFIAICTIKSKHLPHIIPMLDTHLQRSKNTPLTLVIHLSVVNCSEVDISRNGTVCADMAIKLLTEQHRWEEVDLDFSGEGTTPSIDPPYSLVLPLQQDSLVTLRFRWQWDMVVYLGACPRLERIDLHLDSSTEDMSIVDYDQSKTKCYFPKLRTVRLHCDGIDAFEFAWAIVLHACSAPVEELEIRAWVPIRPDEVTLDVPPSPLRFPALRKLSLEILPSGFTHRILPRFELPSLTRLELGSLNCDNETVALLAPLLSNFPLEALDMRFAFEVRSFKPDILREFLLSLGEVQSLSFRRMHNDAFRSSLVGLLTVVFNQEQGPLLPSLSSLYLDLEPREVVNGGFSGISFLRDLISICQRKYVKFHFAFSSQIIGQNRTESTVMFLGDLLDDELIRSYVTEDFRITFNGVDVVDTSNSCTI